MDITENIAYRAFRAEDATSYSASARSKFPTRKTIINGQKRFLKTLLLLVLLLRVIIVQAQDYSFSIQTSNGQTLFFNILNGSQVQLTHESNYSPFYSNKPSGELQIPSSVVHEGATYSVVSIGEKSFWGCDNLVTVTIPNSVTTIGADAFVGCKSLTSVSLPSSITTIANGTFMGCHSLASIAIPQGVTSIGEDAFSNCVGLVSVSIPSSVNSIGRYAFRNCSSLSSITIPPSVTTLQEEVFYYCTSLSAITLPSTITTIGVRAFAGCRNLESIALPAGLVTIGNEAFSYCTEIMTITIPNTVTNIGNKAFLCCSKLSGINIGTNVTSIGSEAFTECHSLQSIVIPNSVTNIGMRAFKFCSRLERVTLSNSLTQIINDLFAYCGNLDSVEIHSGVTKIGTNAFLGCRGLSAVTLPATLAEIGSAAFQSCEMMENITIPNSVTQIGTGAFSYCYSLKSIILPNALNQINANTFEYCSNLQYVFLPSSITAIGNKAFANCGKLSCVTIAGNVSSIGSNAFQGVNRIRYNGTAAGSPWGAGEIQNHWYYNNGLYYTSSAMDTLTGADITIDTLVIPTSVNTIGVYALAHHTDLVSVTIPNSVTAIGTSAFADCYSLSPVTIPNNVASIASDAFTDVTMIYYQGSVGGSFGARCRNGYEENGLYYTNSSKTSLIGANRDVTVANIPSSVLTIKAKAFYNHKLLETVTIPSSVGMILNSTFEGCTSLSSINIPSNVTALGSDCFKNCKSLTTITLPSALTQIVNNLFYNCSSLQSITIPNSVTNIGHSAFYGCSDLESVTFGNSLQSLGTQAFRYCRSLSSITLPATVSNTGESVFANCSALESIALPESLTHMGRFMFQYCPSLTTVTGGSNIQTIGEYSFDGCIGLSTFHCFNALDSIGQYVFRGCSRLRRVEFNTALSAIGSNAFYRCASIDTLYLNERLKRIHNQVFTYCYGLKHIEMPDSLTTIGSDAFYGCSNLLKLDLADKLRAIDNSAFSECYALETITTGSSLNTINSSVFLNCKRLISVDLSPAVREIKSTAFYGCAKLPHIVIPDSVTTIESNAFTNNSSMRSAVIGVDVNFIGNQAFSTGNPLCVTFKRCTPASLGTQVFSNGSNFFVPQGCLSAYQGATGYTSLNIAERHQYSASVSGGHGTVQIIDTFGCSSTVTFVANAESGYHFAGWSDGSTDSIYTVTLTQDTNLLASFISNASTPSGVPLPYCESFDSYPSGEGNMPTYWKGYNTLSIDNGRYPFISTTDYYSPYKSLEMHIMGDNSCFAILPDFAIDSLQQLRLHFMLRNRPTYNGLFIIGVLPDTNDISSFVPLDTIFPPDSHYIPVDYSFENYHGTARRVSFLDRPATGSAHHNLYIEDFIADTWEHPAIIETDVTTYSSYTWTDGNTYDSDTTVREMLTSTSTCGSIAQLNLKVLPPNTVELPYCEDFDSYPSGEGHMPTYWKGYNTLSMDLGRFPHVSSGRSHSPSNCFCMRAFSNYSCYAMLPNFNLDSIQQLNISFNVMKNDDEPGRLIMGVLTDTTSYNSFIPLDTIDIPLYNQWVPVQYSYRNYHGAAKRGCILDRRIYNSAGNLYIDDFVADTWERPRLERYNGTVVRVTSNNADYWLEYGAHGFTPGSSSSTLLHVNQNPYILTGLDSSATYDFYAYPYNGPYLDRGSCSNPLAVVNIIQSSVTIVNDTSICDVISFTWKGHYFTASGEYRDTISTPLGYDSIFVTRVQMHSSSSTIDSVTGCNSFTWQNGITYNASTTTPQVVLNNMFGCDSIIHLHLTIYPQENNTLNVSACDSYTWDVTGQTYTTDTIVEVITQSGTCYDTTMLILMIRPSPTLTHIPDTIINQGTSVTLHASGANLFTWFDADGNVLSNSSDITLSPSTSTTYYFDAFNDGVNIIHNGDFELGNVGFNTSYHYSSNLYPEAYYYIDSNAHNYHSGFTGAHDHTSGSGKYMIVNGAGTAGVNVWSQTVSVSPHTEYAFSVWVCSVSPYPISLQALLQFSINGTQIGEPFRAPLNLNTWINFYEVWNSGENTTATISILNQNTASGGNDFGIDDISFTDLISCRSHDSVRVLVGHHYDRTICSNQLPYTWNGVTFTRAGVASATLTGSHGQDSIVLMNLMVKPSLQAEAFDTICDNNHFLFNGTNLTSSGTYLDTLTAQNGCDSIVTLQLTVKNSSSGDTSATACDSFTWYGTTYTAGGTLEYHLTNAAGCDSTATLHLTVNHSNSAIETITACNSFYWHGDFFTESTNNATFTSSNSQGCDSVTTLHLTINHCSTTILTVCDSHTWNGTLYSTSGTYIQGSDTLVLTVNHSTSGDTTATACDSFTWHGTTYTAGGMPEYHLTNASGCYSTVTLHLTVNYSSSGDTTAIACDNFTWYGNTYTTGVTPQYPPTRTITNAAGCDSIVTLNLTLHNSTTGDTTAIACDSFTWHGTTYTASETPEYHLTNAAGCDSTATLHLTVNYSSSGDTSATACDSFTWYGTTYTAGGTLEYHLTNAAGCDSTATLHLTVNYSSQSNYSETIIENQLPYTFIGRLYTISDFHNYTLNDTITITNAVGCDSIIYYNLTFSPNKNTYLDSSVCDNEIPIIWDNIIFTEAVTKIDSLIASSGADSLVHRTLIVHSTYHWHDTATICENSFPYTWRDSTFAIGTESGDYTLSRSSIYGCDSIISINLTISPIYAYYDTAAICADATPYVWLDTSINISSTISTSQTNIYSLHRYTSNGCDSIRTLILSIHPLFDIHDSITICENALPLTWRDTTIAIGNHSGIFTRNYPSINLCDSTCTLHLTIDTNTSGIVHEYIVENDLPYTYHGVTMYGDTNGIDILLQNVHNCDSNVTYSLTVWRNTFSNIDSSICQNELPFHWNNITFTGDSTFYNPQQHTFNLSDTLTSHTGADSIVYMHLTIQSIYHTDEVQNLCRDALPYTWHDTLFSEGQNSGVFHRNYQSVFGCDSSFTLQLTINEVYNTIDSVQSCTPYTWINGITYTSPTTDPIFMLNSIAGCDSVIHLYFSYFEPVFTMLTDSLCAGSTYLFGDRELTSGGIYEDTLTAANFCDSIITLTLTQLTPPAIEITTRQDCQSLIHTIQASTTVDYIHWDVNEGTWNPNWGLQSNRQILVRTNKNITLTLTADYTGTETCPASKSITIAPIVQPMAQMKVTPEQLTFGSGNVNAIDLSSGATHHQWFVNSDDFGESHQINYTPNLDEDSIVIMLVATSLYCTDSTATTIRIFHTDIFAPNAFTPDENSNKEFRIFIEDYIDFDLYIYNRQGLLVFHTNDITNAWDGSHKGHPCVQGSYVWILKYTTKDMPKTPQVKKGTVLLLR